MAKFRKKLKSKGKRWVKGQSSVTNPDSKKYRSQAQMNFCKPMFGMYWFFKINCKLN